MVYGNSSNGWLSSFDPVSGTLTDHGNNLTGGWIPLTQTAAIMPTKNQMISVGGGGANYWNLISSGLSPTHTLTTNGCTNLISQTAPGFEWSPVDKMMVGWAGGTKVITMDTAYNCTEVSPSVSNSVTPSAPTLFGTYGRWRYVPKFNIFVVVNSTTGNVFLYRNSPVPVVTPPPPTLPPVVVITSPSQDTIIPGASIVVAYKVDGVAMTKSFNLDRGKNELIVTATNSAGTGADTVYVSQGVQVLGAPTWPLSARLTASNIKATSLTLTWTPAQDDSGVTHYQIYANGALVQRVPASQLTANVVGLFMGTTYKFRVEALDLRENMSVNGPITVATTSNQLPPDPVTIAPHLPYGEVSTMAKMSSFLYKGLNPIQTGLNETVLDPVRTNVVRGQVRGINGNPIPGVTISISNHPEFGSTLTRADGQFDMVINGGGQITVQYSAAGYLDIQRTVSPQWQDFEIIPSVTLIHLDPVVSPFNANASTIQVLKGSVITDSSGTRQPTVLVSPNTGIKITMADGSTTSPTTVHFRATEYTVGPNGPSAMPAALPASSGYTYAVEYSLDEALSVHAKKVEFTRPLYVYVENFIGFSAGTKIPSGSYDREKNQWIPEIDGRVIQIAGITNGKADLIVDKNNTVATSSHLDSIGITSDERIQIASLYSVGQLVWRLPIGHFSPWDHNCSYSPYTNPNAPYTYWVKSPVPNTPDDPEAARPPKADEHTDKTHCHDGSIIDCQNQALGESIHFPGIPSINYRSDRVPSRRWNTLKIPVTGSAGNILPGIITNMSLVIKVAGQTFTYSYSPANSIIQSFEWNGKNAYGQILNGKQPYTYEITYSYAGQYIPAPQLPYYILSSNIGADINNEGTLSWARAGYSSVPGPSYRSAYLKTTKYSGYFGYDNVDDIGPGWTLDGHHQYDPTSGILHLGNGQDIGASKQLEIAYTQIGDGTTSPLSISKLGTPANKIKSGIITAMDIAQMGLSILRTAPMT